MFLNYWIWSFLELRKVILLYSILSEGRSDSKGSRLNSLKLYCWLETYLCAPSWPQSSCTIHHQVRRSTLSLDLHLPHWQFLYNQRSFSPPSLLCCGHRVSYISVFLIQVCKHESSHRSTLQRKHLQHIFLWFKDDRLQEEIQYFRLNIKK